MLKKIITALLFTFCGFVSAQNIPAYGLFIQQGDVGQEFFWGRYFIPASPTSSYFLMYNGGDSKPRMGAIGTGLTWDGTTLDTATIGISSITGLQTALDAKLNQPSGTTSQCVRGDGSVGTCPSSGGSVTSVAVSSSTLSVSGSPVTSSGTITIGMPGTGTAGTYSGVTTDAQGRVTAGTVRSFSYPTRSLNTCYQISSTRDAHVSYAVEVDTTMSLATGQKGTVFLEIFTDSSCTTGTQEVLRSVSGNAGSLTIGLNLTQTGMATLTGIVPAGTWVKQRTQNNTGTPTFTARPGQEVLQ